jgi:uncharacterized protein Yka (UPF0111/DUF47 family)|tara:strand:- start:311 stop:589 length:279 start_codon:yes stop_codon:yes gene_type:complete
MATALEDSIVRIEQKVDKLAEAIVTLARVEEKVAGLKEDHEKSFERMNRFSQRLDEIEKKVDDNHRTVCIINRLVFAAVIAGIGAFIAQLWM